MKISSEFGGPQYKATKNQETCHIKNSSKSTFAIKNIMGHHGSHIVFKRRIFTMVRIIPSIPSHPPSVDGNGVMVNNPIVKMVTKNKLDLDYSQ